MKMILLCAGAFLACQAAFAQDPTVLVFNQPANVFEEALPLGNGHLGAMVYGRIGDELIRLNEATRCEMRLLPVSTPVDSLSQIICMVRTYGVEGQESEVTFYSCLWRPLELTVNDIWQQTFNHPQITLDDLTFRPDAMSQERYQEVRKILTPPLVCVELSPDDDFLTFSLSDVTVPPDDRDDVDVVKMPIKVNWSLVKLKK